MTNAATMLDIFLRARDLVTLPDNDFAWSSWRGVDDALDEIDTIIARLRTGDVPNGIEMSVLFAPTGPMQELSLSSGWGNRFLGLASEFDAALTAK